MCELNLEYIQYEFTKEHVEKTFDQNVGNMSIFVKELSEDCKNDPSNYPWLNSRQTSLS